MAELMCMDCGRVEALPAPFMQWYAQSAAEKPVLWPLKEGFWSKVNVREKGIVNVLTMSLPKRVKG